VKGPHLQWMISRHPHVAVKVPAWGCPAKVLFSSIPTTPKAGEKMKWCGIQQSRPSSNLVTPAAASLQFPDLSRTHTLSRHSPCNVHSQFLQDQRWSHARQLIFLLLQERIARSSDPEVNHHFGTLSAASYSGNGPQARV
jgi:hypothetical protein